MKTSVVCLVTGLVFLFFANWNATADLEVSASVQIHAKAEFEAPLATHGAWIEVGSYGRCWRPAHVEVGWRPYCAGEWVWTDCGWYWASDEPWGWACYHYGYWAYDPGFGWVWVPGVEWAPAWVTWRVGGGYIGWAPLAPPGWVFRHYPEPNHFVFVGEVQFGGPIVASKLIVKNTSVFAKTSELGGVSRESRTLGGAGPQKVMVNNGPKPEAVQKATGRTFKAVSIHDAVRRTAQPRQMAQASKSPGAAREQKNSHGETDRSNGGGPDRDRDMDHGNSRGGQDNFRSSDDRPSRSGFDRGFGGGGDRGGGRGGRGRR